MAGQVHGQYPTCSFDADGFIHSWNVAFAGLTRITATDAAGLNIMHLVDETQQDRLMETLKHSVSNVGITSKEIEVSFDIEQCSLVLLQASGLDQ